MTRRGRIFGQRHHSRFLRMKPDIPPPMSVDRLPAGDGMRIAVSEAGMTGPSVVGGLPPYVTVLQSNVRCDSVAMIPQMPLSPFLQFRVRAISGGL